MKKAADLGEPAAMNNVGMSYLSGSGVEMDIREALVWFEAAAVRGEVSSQFTLASLYANAEIGVQDRPRAYAWLVINRDAGFKKAQAKLDEIEADLAAQVTPDATGIDKAA